jgi:hypothetical protein
MAEVICKVMARAGEAHALVACQNISNGLCPPNIMVLNRIMSLIKCIDHSNQFNNPVWSIWKLDEEPWPKLDIGISK